MKDARWQLPSAVVIVLQSFGDLERRKSHKIIKNLEITTFSKKYKARWQLTNAIVIVFQSFGLDKEKSKILSKNVLKKKQGRN